MPGAGRSPSALRRRRRAAPLAVAALILVLAGSCTTPPEVAPPPTAPPLTTPSSLRVSVGLPGSLDPRDLRSPESLLIASQIFDGLVSFDPESLDVVPAVAARWRVGSSGRRLLFRLRRGARFHDGTSVTAHSFVGAWNRLVNPEDPSPFSFLLEAVEGFEDAMEGRRRARLRGLRVTPNGGLEVRLTRPWPDFVSVLSHPALSPVPATAGDGFAAHPVGNGPYRVEGELGLGTPVELVRFDDYYGEAASIERVSFVISESADESWPDFLAGRLDVASIPTSVLEDAETEFGSDGLVTMARLLYCGFNMDVPAFRDRRVRTAVALAIDRRFVAGRVYSGLAVAAPTLVPPTLPGHQDDGCGDSCERDVDRASALVDELPARRRAFELDYADSPIGVRLATALTAQLEEVGFNVSARGHDEAGLRELLESGDHELFCLAWVADYPRQQAILEPLLWSESEDNQTGFADRPLNRLLGRARAQR
ncbi:MAG: ABC transporter substrate-binding protein, partial [Actinomycetota bacterium]|nr:ABC transporter substrate-binding protein [Actinomycetota bacterium]